MKPQKMRLGGFTLVEALVSVVILGIVGAGAVWLFQKAISVWSELTQGMGVEQESRRALETARRTLSSARAGSLEISTAGISGLDEAGQAFRLLLQDGQLLAERGGNRWVAAKNLAELVFSTPSARSVEVRILIRQGRREKLTEQLVYLRNP